MPGVEVLNYLQEKLPNHCALIILNKKEEKNITPQIIFLTLFNLMKVKQEMTRKKNPFRIDWGILKQQ